MTSYVITNITETLNKKHPKFSSAVQFPVINGFKRNNIILNPGNFIILECENLPIAIHELRLKKLIDVKEATLYHKQLAINQKYDSHEILNSVEDGGTDDDGSQEYKEKKRKKTDVE